MLSSIGRDILALKRARSQLPRDNRNGFCLLTRQINRLACTAAKNWG